ncbi:hypothetical protein EJB05_37828, partial [Eragrostis curvula]
MSASRPHPAALGLPRAAIKGARLLHCSSHLKLVELFFLPPVKMNFISGIKRKVTGRSQGSSSHSGWDSSIPRVAGAPPPPIAPVEPPPPVELILRILEQQEHIIPRSEEERNCIEGLVDHDFQHSRVFDPQFLHAIGILKEFESTLRYTSLTDFSDTAELGSRWLSIEFLASLQVVTEEGMANARFKFHMFNEEYDKSFKGVTTGNPFFPECRLNSRV